MSGSSPKSISISGVETDITIGKELAAVAQKSKALASRDCFEQLEMYLHGRSHDRVCLLFGLLQTGKNTMLRQAIGRMTKEDLSRIAYIKARRTDNMAMMNRDLKKLFNAGFRYKVSTDDLVKLKRIRKAAEQGEFDILLVFMYDRLGRNLNETPFIAEWFTKKGIHVWSVYEGEIIDGVDAERMLDYIRFWQTDEAQKL